MALGSLWSARGCLLGFGCRRHLSHGHLWPLHFQQIPSKGLYISFSACPSHVPCLRKWFLVAQTTILSPVFRSMSSSVFSVRRLLCSLLFQACAVTVVRTDPPVFNLNNISHSNSCQCHLSQTRPDPVSLFLISFSITQDLLVH